MNYINFDCQAEVLAVADAPAIFSGDRNTVYAKFSFSNDWARYAKTAIFYKDKKSVYAVLLDAHDEAAVPSQVMAEKGAFYVGVVGAAGEEVQTSSVVKIKVGQGAISTDARPDDPAPDIYAEILGQYQNAVNVAVTEHAEKLQETADAVAECYAAISAMGLVMNDFDGGGPTTEEDAADDVNGGTPSTI